MTCPTVTALVIEDLAGDLFEAQMRLRESIEDVAILRETLKVALDKLYEMSSTIDKLRERQRELTGMLK